MKPVYSNKHWMSLPQRTPLERGLRHQFDPKLRPVLLSHDVLHDPVENTNDLRGRIVRPPFPEMLIEVLLRDERGRQCFFVVSVESVVDGAHHGLAESRFNLYAAYLHRGAAIGVHGMMTVIADDLGRYQDCVVFAEERSLRRVFAAALIALGWCHVKDFDVVNREPTATERRRKKGSSDRGIVYKVLDIRPGSRLARQIGRTGGPTDIRAHLRRGHFRLYTPERPHVSGFVGQMWISACMVGDRKNGEVRKTYRARH